MCLFKYWSSFRLEDGVVAYKQSRYEESFQSLNLLAKMGNKPAQYIVGLSYAYGQGVNVDSNKALELLVKSEENPSVTFEEIGMVYNKGNSMIKPNADLSVF